MIYYEYIQGFSNPVILQVQPFLSWWGAKIMN